MRKLYSFGLVAFLAATPAMAQVVIGGDNDAARHEWSTDQDRMRAHRDHREARRDAEMGDYRGAARDQRDAHRDWREANRQDYRTDRDNDRPSIVFGH